MVEYDIGHAFDLAMARDGDYRNGNGMLKRSIDGNDALRAAANQHARVILHQVLAMPVVRRKVEISRIDELIADAAHHLSVIATAQFGNKDADRQSAPVAQGIGLTVLGNAPIVDADTGTFLQVSRSDWDCVILLAQARAAWKQGGAEFKASLELEKAALQMAAAENTRLRSLGAFSDVIDQRGNQQERDMNRFNNSNKGK